MDDDFGFTLRGRVYDRKGDETTGRDEEQKEETDGKEERWDGSSSSQPHHSGQLPVVREEVGANEGGEGEKSMNNDIQDVQEKTVLTPMATSMDERSQEMTNPNFVPVSDTKSSVVMQNYLDSLNRVVENTTYWDNDEEFSDMEEALMMPNPEYEPYIQMDPIPGKDDELPFQQGEVQQLADDYY